MSRQNHPDSWTSLLQPEVLPKDESLKAYLEYMTDIQRTSSKGNTMVIPWTAPSTEVAEVADIFQWLEKAGLKVGPTLRHCIEKIQDANYAKIPEKVQHIRYKMQTD